MNQCLERVLDLEIGVCGYPASINGPDENATIETHQLIICLSSGNAVGSLDYVKETDFERKLVNTAFDTFEEKVSDLLCIRLWGQKLGLRSCIENWCNILVMKKGRQRARTSQANPARCASLAWRTVHHLENEK